MTNDILEVPLLAEYGTYHRDPRNRWCHEFGIPLIVLSIIALLRLVHYERFDLAQVAIVLVCFYYLRLVGAKALTTIVVFALLYVVSWYVEWPVAIGLFVVGWILQFVGHMFEGKSPAFMTNLVHLLIGPLWIVAVSTTRRSA